MARRAQLLRTLLLLAAAAAEIAAAQDDALGGVVADPEAAVKAVAAALERGLGPEAWCAVGAGCGEACAPHECAAGGIARKELACVDLGGLQLDEGLCGERTKRNLVSKGRAFFRTPRGAAVEVDGGKVKVEDTVVLRDVCALKGVEDELIAAHKKNGLTFWLYGGTTSGAYMSYPGTLAHRGEKGGTFADCSASASTYDPRARPWYIAASSGPKDVVFLFDKKLAAAETRLQEALVATVGALDARDHVAVVAFDGDRADVLNAGGGLEVATTSAREALKSAIGAVTSSSGATNVSLALGKAFDLLEAAGTKDGGTTSGCSRLIVLLSRTDDACFAKCTGRNALARCQCVQDTRKFVDARQEALGDRPATLVAFTEGAGRGANRLARTLVCDRKSSGIWSDVGEGVPGGAAAMQSYAQITAARLYDDEPKVFVSELYEDYSGLGKIITLAVPVYDKDRRRLVAVAGADVTLAEVQAKYGASAEEEINKLSAKTRDCANERQLESCDLQALRSQTQSECADILPTATCYQFGEAVYLKTGNASSWDDASAECAALGDGARLAKVNTPRLNEFLAGIFDGDGDWIGLRSNKGEDWVWADGAALADGEEQWAGFDGKAEAAQVQQDMNGAACAVADRRGSGQNWDVLSCSAERTYVCEVVTGSAAAKAACGGDLFDGQSSANGHTPVNAADCPTVVGMSCSTEENKKLDGLEPFCASSGDDRSNKEAICCDGGGVSNGLIAGAALGVIFVVAIVAVIVICCCVCRNSSSSSSSAAAATTLNSPASIGRTLLPRWPSHQRPTGTRPAEPHSYPAFSARISGDISAIEPPGHRPWRLWG